MSSTVTGRSVAIAMLCAAIAGVLGAAIAVPTRATYGATTTADEPQYLLTAISLAEDGDLDISDELADERWRDFHEAKLPQQTRPLPDGSRISPHDPLLPVLLAPAVGAVGWRGAQWTLVGLAGILAALLVWTAVRRLGVRPAVAAVVVGTLGASVPLAAYGSEVYPELPAALVVAVALAVLLRADLRVRDVALVGVAVVALPWLAVKYAPVALVLAAAVAGRLLRDDRRREVVWLGTVLALAGAAYLAIHQVVWTGWTVYASGDHFVDSGELGVMGFSPDFASRTVRLSALLAEERFGLAVWQPAWLLLLPALGAWLRRGPRGRALLPAVLGAGWLTATFVALTMAGWWFPGRQVVVVLPVAVLLVAWWVDHAARRLVVFALLGTVGIVSWIWLVTDVLAARMTFVVDFYLTGNPLVQAWARVFPDFQEPDGATWPLHALWVVLLLGLAAWGWYRAATTTPPTERAGAQTG